MCRIDGAEGWKVWRCEKPVAKREHRCDECRRAIQPGESYLREGGLSYDGGGWETYKTCRHCDAARRWLVIVCGGAIFSEVLEELREHWQESDTYRSLWLNAAMAGIRRQWKRRDGSLLPVLPEPRFAEGLAA